MPRPFLWLWGLRHSLQSTPSANERCPASGRVSDQAAKLIKIMRVTSLEEHSNGVKHGRGYKSDHKDDLDIFFFEH